MLCVVLLYFSVASTSFKGPDGQYSRTLINGYWAWFKWALMFAFVLLIIGCVSLFNAVQGLYDLALLSSRACNAAAPLSLLARAKAT